MHVPNGDTQLVDGKANVQTDCPQSHFPHSPPLAVGVLLKAVSDPAGSGMTEGPWTGLLLFRGSCFLICEIK